MIQLAAGHIATVESTRIFSLHRKDIIVLSNKDLLDVENHRLKITPVYLTAEFLEKNHFVRFARSEHSFSCIDNNLTIVVIQRNPDLWFVVITGKNSSDFQTIRINISYIHELQVLLQSVNSTKQLHL